MQETVKGIFLISIVEAVKNDKGPEALAQLKKLMGAIDYSGLSDYPVAEEMKLHKAAMEVLYGSVSRANYRELGKLNFTIYANSMIGKTMISLFGSNVKRFAMSLQTVFKTISSGVEIETISLGDCSVKITVKGVPYPVEYYEGIWQGGLAHLEQKGIIRESTVSSATLREGEYEYTIVWY